MSKAHNKIAFILIKNQKLIKLQYKNNKNSNNAEM